MAGNKNKMMISWIVEDDLFLFKLTCNTRGYVGLAFSYSDLPLDGFVAGVGEDDDPYVHDLHLDFAGKTNLSNSKKPETLSFFLSFILSFFLSFLSNFPDL